MIGINDRLSDRDSVDFQTNLSYNSSMYNLHSQYNINHGFKTYQTFFLISAIFNTNAKSTPTHLYSNLFVTKLNGP